MIPIILAATVSASQIGDLQTYRDWIVGCDNRHACHATTLYPEPTPQEAETGADSVADNAIGMAILRGAGANDAARVRFLPCYPCDNQDSPDPAAVRRLAVLDKAGKVLFGLKLGSPDASLANASEGLPVSADSASLSGAGRG